MSEKTAKMYVAPAELKAGMRVSVKPNEPLREVIDVVVLGSDDWRRVTFSDPDPRRSLNESYAPTDKIEVHLTLDEAVAEFYRLDHAEREAFAAAHAIGERRSSMAALAGSLGWRG